MDYKRIIKSQKTRFAILSFLKFIPSPLMLKMQYRIKTGHKLNLKHPKRFTEWLQWYKIKYRNPVLHQCVDKYEVRNFVTSKGLDNILNGLIGIYDDVEDINFDKLPNKFVIKTTNGGGGQNVLICKDKRSLDIASARANFKTWLHRKSVDAGREWAYTGITKPRIIVEEFLENPVEPEAGISDYKILCFGGVPKIIIYDCDRYIEHRRNVYDTEWNRIFVDSDCKQKEVEIPKPENFQDMLDIASKLSEDFPFVRVDLYNLKGKIFFGELTFYPWSGYVTFNPDSFDFELGRFFNELSLSKL